MVGQVVRPVLAKIVEPTEDSLREAARRIQRGQLVAFPTETVYGLGANALDADAVLRIFEAKGRPLTDPVIVHVASPVDALPLIVFDSLAERRLFDIMAGALWPGPVTFVCKANPSAVPPVVTANTGWVGVRCPDHPLCRKFLTCCERPVSAPSANRFGHVSPTSAQHVLDDLSLQDVWILDGGVTQIGIESTVLKLDGDRSRCVLLRRGGVSESRIVQVLQDHSADLPPNMELVILNKSVSGHEAAAEGQEAPGQLLTHYAPDVPAFLASISAETSEGAPLPVRLASSVVLDFAGLLSAVHGANVAFYRDMSPAGSAAECSRTLFDSLRWAEDVGAGLDGACVLIADIRPLLAEREDLRAVFDRMFRACSGRSACICDAGGALSLRTVAPS